MPRGSTRSRRGRATAMSLQNCSCPTTNTGYSLTKLLVLGLAVANDQWDQNLECTVNAILPALMAAGFFILGCREFCRRWEVPLFLLLLAAFALPLSWRNIVSGFHSQQFFLIDLSLAALVWLPFARPWSPRWWLGAACALLALGSMASGFVAAAVVIALLALRIRRREISARESLPSLALCSAAVLVGFIARVSVPGHEVLKAHTGHDFVMTVVRSLQWPGSASAWFAILFWLPWLLLVLRVLCLQAGVPSISSPSRHFGYLLAGLGGWVLIQLMATAYARGAGGPAPISRYLDTLAFGQVVNGLAWIWLWRERPFPGPPPRAALALLGLAWAAGFAVGAGAQTNLSLSVELPEIKVLFVRSEQLVRGYLATGDESYLDHSEIPYPSKPVLIDRIRIPALRALLPVSVRPGLALAQAGTPGVFLRSDARAGSGPADAATGSAALPPAMPLLENRVAWGSYGSGAPRTAAVGRARPSTRPGADG